MSTCRGNNHDASTLSLSQRMEIKTLKWKTGRPLMLLILPKRDASAVFHPFLPITFIKLT